MVDEAGPRPCMVMTARRAETDLAGTLVGFWAPEPLDRFDLLTEQACPRGYHANHRPRDGVWHFVAVTSASGHRGRNVGRFLVNHALSQLRKDGGSELSARTLSPAFGLPALVACAGESWTAEAIRRVLDNLCDAEGRPALPVMRLHLGAGAWLDAVLIDSRRADLTSGAVTLRFGYALDRDARAARQAQYNAQVDARGLAIAAGRASRVGEFWSIESQPRRVANSR